jgi:hypothetical protein
MGWGLSLKVGMNTLKLRSVANDGEQQIPPLPFDSFHSLRVRSG